MLIVNEDSNSGFFKVSELKSFENNLLLSGGLKHHHKDFAGETFS